MFYSTYLQLSLVDLQIALPKMEAESNIQKECLLLQESHEFCTTYFPLVRNAVLKAMH